MSTKRPPIREKHPATRGRGTALGDLFRRKRAKLGPVGAVTALGHKSARIRYTMIKILTAFDPAKLGNLALIRQRK